jgi:UDP-GlcNAc:undecaprenyl-phosphate/decaprenyl-phosphate GlcNAc-1-phosphate transferase
MVYIFLISLVISFVSFYLYKRISFKFNLVDKPDKINVHKKVIPTGAGIIFFTTFTLLLIFSQYLSYHKIINFLLPKNFIVFFSSLLILTIISFYDDLKKVHPVIRLFFQLSIIFFCSSLFDLSFIPISIKILIIFIVYFWVYTINIINFTDGVDGFLGVNSANFFLCSSIFYGINLSDNFIYLMSIICLGMITSYLYFNKPNAKIFMGDTGSIFIGFLIGYVSLKLIFLGRYDIVISLLAYTYIDCTLTIIKKMFSGRLPWARLFDYYFLIPIKNNYSHKKVFFANIIHNVIIFFVVLVQILFDLKMMCFLSIFSSIFLIYFFKSFGKPQYR